MRSRPSVVSQARAEAYPPSPEATIQPAHMHWEVIEAYMDNEHYSPDHATLVRFVEDLLYHIRLQEHGGGQPHHYEPQHLGTNAYPAEHEGYPEQHYGYPPAHETYPPAHKGYPPAHEGYPQQHQEPGYGFQVPSAAQQGRNYGLEPSGDFTLSLGFTSSNAISPDAGDI